MPPQIFDAVKSDTSASTAAADAEATSPDAPTQSVSAVTVPINPVPASQEECTEFEGTTVFAAPPSPTYRYALSLKKGKLRIWLENCESKKQWCTTELSLHDYVDSSNIIPDATALDYVECFRELLDTASADVNDIPTHFQRHRADAFKLELNVEIQVLRKSRVVTYTFELEPISVERIDILESKLRDLQDKVEAFDTKDLEATANHSSAVLKLEGGLKKLRQDVDSRNTIISQLKEEVKLLHHADESPVITLALATTNVGDLVSWKNAAFTFGLNVTGLDGVVRVDSPGIYQVMAVINHQTGGNNLSIQLMKGSECIQSAYCGVVVSNQVSSSSTSLMCTVRMNKTDQLRVKCPATLSGTSYMTLIRLGK